ncbi:MAG: DNA damage-inducible protein D [Candidatus Gracilibacteria bacterium]
MNLFEQIKHVNKYGSEYWSARNLMLPLGYIEWRKFEGAIQRAKEACKNSGQKIENHFAHADKMVLIGSEAKREIKDYHLSRYACYLIAQNGDPRKEEIAFAQTYFAIQTRRQEAGVINFANFQDFGYMGLYGGLRQKDIRIKKKLEPSQKILDHMVSEELAANLFRATQTEAKLKRENVVGENKANATHYDVGKKVRKTIKELGGTMPEKLPASEHIDISRKKLTNR